MASRLEHRAWMVGLVLSIGTGRSAAQARPADERPPTPAPAAASATPVAASPVAASAELDFAATLREMRSALREVAAQREGAQKKADKIKEACLYERQRAIAQAVDSAEVAQVGWELAVKQGETVKARDEQARALKAVELVRSLRGAAESCIGEELRGASKATTVTANGPGKLDDPKAGPVESATANTLRLELPSRPNPSSAYRPAR